MSSDPDSEMNTDIPLHPFRRDANKKAYSAKHKTFPPQVIPEVPPQPMIYFKRIRKEYQQPIPKNEISLVPLDPGQPCPIASLPTELRSMIYEHVFRPYKKMMIESLRPRPALLNVCRAICTEAGYNYYTRTAFRINIRNMDFSVLLNWLNNLPFAHREFLGLNRNLKINLDIESCTWRNHGIDESEIWRYCCQFGRTPRLNKYTNRWTFLQFCRLAEWWVWCGQPMHENIKWHYCINFGDSYHYPDTWSYHETASEKLLDVLEDRLSAPMLPCVQKKWTRSRDLKGKMKKEFLNMLNGFNKAFEGLVEAQAMHLQRKKGRKPRSIRTLTVTEEEKEKWKRTMKALKKDVNGWS